SAERGYDPRDFTLIAFGGGGPAHGAALAREIGFPSVLVPSVPGVFSAFGLLIADIRHDYAQSYISRADLVSLEAVSDIFDSMKTLSEQALNEDAIADEQREYLRTADMRYVGQAYEVNVPVPDGPVNKELIAAIVLRFHDEHQRQFAHSSMSDPVELVNLRMIAMGRVEALELSKNETASGDSAPVSHREVYFEESDGFVSCPIYERYALKTGTEINGPAILEQLDCTTVVHPGQGVCVDEWGNLIISVGD
ncbi:MAG: hydantoinase/oxoprolinase family protein, partial [Rhodospirillaceae bacterium]|nr:hydantoinase/oxoprolinase family protein [Rhodospirillaceae bacterium]